MPLLEELVKPVHTDMEDSLDHLYCDICDPDGLVAFCGLDVSGMDFKEFDIEDEGVCVVCIDIDASHFEREHEGEE